MKTYTLSLEFEEKEHCVEFHKWVLNQLQSGKAPQHSVMINVVER